LACVVTDASSNVDTGTLPTHLEETLDQPAWWIPDEIKEVRTIPKTATGKFDKQALRTRLDPTGLDDED
jgi:fatty-acyl-CoA synthase